MVPIEALKLALDKEKASMKFYENLAKEHSAINELLTELHDEEYKHVKTIEEKIRQLSKY